MLFSELLAQLTYGELSQHSVTNNGDEIEPCNYANIAAHANLGLTNLFTRFAIRKEEVKVLLSTATTYALREKYGLFSGSAEPVKYLIDTATSPFKGNVIKVLAAFGSDEVELPINNSDDDTSIFLPTFDIIRVPVPVAGEIITIEYQSKHDSIVVDATTDPTTISIEIPEIIIEPLTSFIGSRILSPMGKDGLAEGNNYLLKYEALCRSIEQFGVFNKDNSVPDYTTDNGWV